MDLDATIRRFYALISAGDIDGFGGLLAEDFVEHEETPGLSPTKDGVVAFFKMQRAAFPDMDMAPEDVLVIDMLGMLQQLGAIPAPPAA